MRPHVPRFIATLLLSLAAGCSVDEHSPVEVTTAQASAVKFWNANATVNWNARADALCTRRPAGLNAARVGVYVALAQLRAAEAAEATPGPHPPTSAAIGAASAAILNAFFPLDVAENESELDAQEAADPWPGAKHEDWAAGEAIGRAIAARVLVFASTDRVGLTNPGLPPVGPQFWRANGGPIARGQLGARPFFLASTDELRPPPPPAFDSPEFAAALAEVRQITQSRTDAQRTIALYWNVNQSPVSDAAVHAIARDLLRTHRVKEVESARILFRMEAARWDAAAGCFDAKYHYWLVRPPQADPAIPLIFPVPPHPSYPSAHSCIVGAFTAVLEQAFPDQAEYLASVRAEAGMSRIYAGLHYRFDVVAGQALGRAAADKAIAGDLDAVGVLP